MTDDICSVCYEGEIDMVLPDEIMSKRNIGGKIPLTICRDCFDANLPIPSSGGRKTNVKQKKKQGQSKKRSQLDNAVQSGRRKIRKTS